MNEVMPARRRLRVVPNAGADSSPADTDRNEPPDTDSEVPIGSSDGAGVGVGVPTRETGARARARLADGSENTDGDTDAGESAAEGGTSGSPRRRILRPGMWLRSLASLPDVVRTDRPSLRRCFNYARWGEQHPPGGFLRGLSVVLSLPLLVFVTAAYLVAWTFERPARAVNVCVLLWLLTRVPAVHDVVAAVGRLLVWPLSIGL